MIPKVSYTVVAYDSIFFQTIIGWNDFLVFFDDFCAVLITIWKHPVLSLKGPNVLHSLPLDFDWCQPQQDGKGRNSLGNAHQAMMQGGKNKSYKAAICWFLDSHFPTSCEEGVRWSFFPCFLVERNAPQKRPVLFAKSGHAI